MLNERNPINSYYCVFVRTFLLHFITVPEQFRLRLYDKLRFRFGFHTAKSYGSGSTTLESTVDQLNWSNKNYDLLLFTNSRHMTLHRKLVLRSDGINFFFSDLKSTIKSSKYRIHATPRTTLNSDSGA
jgi:hypothetical protein